MGEKGKFNFILNKINWFLSMYFINGLILWFSRMV